MFSRDVIIGIIPTANSTNVFIPELTYILRSKTVMKALSSSDPKLSEEFSSRLLKNKDDANPPAVLACSMFEAVKLLEKIYTTLLKAKVALPPAVHSSELSDWLKKEQDLCTTKMPQFSYQLLLNENNLGSYGKNLPRIGRVISYTLTIGTTVATATGVFKWGWGNALISLFIGSRLIANYHDIINGPENRMRKIGIAIDRFFSDPYQGIGKYSPTKMGIYFVSSLIMICSAYLAFNSALFTIQSICLIYYLPSLAINLLSYFFAAAMTYSHFGRIFNSVFDAIASRLKAVFDLADSKDNERLDLAKTLQLIGEKTSDTAAVEALSQKSTYLGFSKNLDKSTTTRVASEQLSSEKPIASVRLAV